MYPFASLALALLLTDAGPASGFSWLSGHWRSQNEDNVSEEFWTDMRGGLMLGSNRTLRGGRAAAFEYMRIVQSDTPHYCAQPQGGEAVCFQLTEYGDGFAAFENAAHDFPQRIEYRREGETLTARVSDLEGGNAVSWSWQRVE